MYIVGYHIFINLLVNHIKNNSVKYRQFVLIFTLVNAAMLFSFFFCAINNFCSTIYNRRLFSQENG